MNRSKDLDDALNVAVVYEDTRTQEWARQVCSRVRHLIGEEGVRTNWWQADLLRDVEVLAEALSAASAAELLVVSVYASDQLPLDLYAWIDAWLSRRQVPTGALVALICVPDGAGSQAFRTRDYLQAVARTGGLDFLPHEQSVPREGAQTWKAPKSGS